MIGHLIQSIAKHFHFKILFFQLTEEMGPNFPKFNGRVLLDHYLPLIRNLTKAEQTHDFARWSVMLGTRVSGPFLCGL